MKRNLLAALLAGLLMFAGAACAEDAGDDEIVPEDGLEEPADEGLEEPTDDALSPTETAT